MFQDGSIETISSRSGRASARTQPISNAPSAHWFPVHSRYATKGHAGKASAAHPSPQSSAESTQRAITVPHKCKTYLHADHLLGTKLTLTRTHKSARPHTPDTTHASCDCDTPRIRVHTDKFVRAIHSFQSLFLLTISSTI